MKSFLLAVVLLCAASIAFADPTINQFTMIGGIAGTGNQLSLDTSVGSATFVGGFAPFQFDSSGAFNADWSNFTFGDCCSVPKPGEIFSIRGSLVASGVMGINFETGTPYAGSATLTILRLSVLDSMLNTITYTNYGTYTAGFTLNYIGCDASSIGCAPGFYPHYYEVSASNLTPTPEPSSLAFMLIGALLVWHCAVSRFEVYR